MKLESAEPVVKQSPTLLNEQAELNPGDPIVIEELPRLEKFPKELKKRFYQGIDSRYAIILLSSLFLHFVLALYVSSHLSKKDSVKSVEKVRKQFAKFILEGRNRFPEVLKRTEPPEAKNTSNFNILDSFLNKMDTYEPEIDKLLKIPESSDLAAKTKPSDRIKANRELNTARRHAARDEMIEGVQRVGLLSIITSGSGVVTYAEIANILDFADSTSGELEKRLAFLTSLKVPRDPRLADYRFLHQGDGFQSEPPAIKGSRVYPDYVKVNDLVEKLGNTKKIKVTKTKEYEEVPSASHALEKLRTRQHADTITRMTRDPGQVRKVVMSHYPAIQDCYKQSLKRNPVLRGKVVIRFVVAPDGKVIDASIVSSNINDDEMLDCILARVLRWNDFSVLNPAASNMAIKQSYMFGLH
ncbi:MAG: AgmX/PglI C-terminal domain-containing protein [bacterium]